MLFVAYWKTTAELTLRILSSENVQCWKLCVMPCYENAAVGRSSKGDADLMQSLIVRFGF